MKQITLAKKLIENYKGINNTIPYINKGGCGIFAQYLYEYLVMLNLNPKLVVYTNDLQDMEYLVENPYHTNNANMIHVAVSIEGKIIDSHGLQTRFEALKLERYAKTDKLRYENLIKFNKQWHLWNQVFDRDDSKKIERILRNAYKKVKKDLVVKK